MHMCTMITMKESQTQDTAETWQESISQNDKKDEDKKFNQSIDKLMIH